MSLAEIEEAVHNWNREELTRLAAYIAGQDKLSWDEKWKGAFLPAASRRLFCGDKILASTGLHFSFASGASV
jgi:hypothetical protein